MVSRPDFKKILTLRGSWSPSSDGSSIKFLPTSSGGVNSSIGIDPSPFGLALFGGKAEDGVFECSVQLDEIEDHPRAMIVFKASGEQGYYAAGIGGFENAYSILSYTRRGTTQLGGAGSADNIEPKREYRLRVAVKGQRAEFQVNGVKVVSTSGVTRKQGDSYGILCAESNAGVSFSNFAIEDRKPQAFIVMQFSSPYNEVYRDAIQQLVSDNGFDPVRVDDIDHPGIIIDDIRNQIAESSIVIADITVANPNVYYEVGMSHALSKPTILLAERGTKLPFDVGPHRCIFYENSIPGRARLQDSLRRSLEALAGSFEGTEITN